MNRLLNKDHIEEITSNLNNDEFISSLIALIDDLLSLTQGQQKEIKAGINNGLSISQIQLYSNPNLSFKQMRSLRTLLEIGVNVDIIILLSNSDLNYKQILVAGYAMSIGIDRDWALGFVEYDQCDTIYNMYARSWYSTDKSKYDIKYNFSHDFYMMSIEIFMKTGVKRILPSNKVED